MVRCTPAEDWHSRAVDKAVHCSWSSVRPTLEHQVCKLVKRPQRANDFPPVSQLRQGDSQAGDGSQGVHYHCSEKVQALKQAARVNAASDARQCAATAAVRAKNALPPPAQAAACLAPPPAPALVAGCPLCWEVGAPGPPSPPLLLFCKPQAAGGGRAVSGDGSDSRLVALRRCHRG